MNKSVYGVYSCFWCVIHPPYIEGCMCAHCERLWIRVIATSNPHLCSLSPVLPRRIASMHSGGGSLRRVYRSVSREEERKRCALVLEGRLFVCKYRDVFLWYAFTSTWRRVLPRMVEESTYERFAWFSISIDISIHASTPADMCVDTQTQSS